MSDVLPSCSDWARLARRERVNHGIRLCHRARRNAGTNLGHGTTAYRLEPFENAVSGTPAESGRRRPSQGHGNLNFFFGYVGGFQLAAVVGRQYRPGQLLARIDAEEWDEVTRGLLQGESA